MALLYADENFDYRVTKALRLLGMMWLPFKKWENGAETTLVCWRLRLHKGERC